MGIKKFFKLKPPEEETVEQNRETLNELGYTTKNTNRKRKAKFSAYGNFVRDKNQDKVYAPPGYEPQFNEPEQGQDDLNKADIDAVEPEEDLNATANTDPYGSSSSDPYAARTDPNSYSSYDPYAQFNKSTRTQQPTRNGYQNVNSFNSSNRAANPYENGYSSYNASSSRTSMNKLSSGGDRRDPYSAPPDPYSADLNAAREDPYGSGRTRSPIKKASPQKRMDPYAAVTDDSASMNLNLAKNELYGNSATYGSSNDASSMNLNATRNGNPAAAGGANSYKPVRHRSQLSAASQKRNPYENIQSANSTPLSSSPYAYSSNSSTPAPVSGSNPYATLGADQYTVGNAMNKLSPRQQQRLNPYGASNSTPNIPRGSDLATPSPSPAFNSDLNVAELDNDDKSTMRAEFEFEQTYDPAQNNETIAGDDDGIDLNATLSETPADKNDYNWQQQQLLQEEEEQYQSYGDGYGNQYGDGQSRGYKTFEEIENEEKQKQQQEEEEEVDEIKQQIKFTKQSSVASTKNTLKMAQDAEMAGMNTLGMLGHQSEKLNNVERNLDLMKVQNVVADDKVKELKKLNRSLLAVHVSNPFNSKRRARDREEQLKNRKMEEKLMFEETNRQLYSSTQRIEGALTGDTSLNHGSEIRERYQRQNILEKSKRYQFENDEEDDEMEMEIDRNLEKIHQISGRLKKLAISTGEELESQQKRIGRIEEDTDNLDIKIHMNTQRLAGIR